MAVYSVQMTIWPTSNLQADATINTWWCDALDDANALLFASEIVELYQAIDEYFPNVVRQNGHTYKIYALADPEPRVPRIEGTFNLPAVPSGIALPQEVAKCLSFQGDPESGVNQASRRGRVYLGPFNTGSQATTGDQQGRPSGTFVGDLAAAGQALLDASGAASDWYWIVYSPTIASSAGLSAAITEVTNGWVDNEWDTIRSRGRVATARATFE